MAEINQTSIADPESFGDVKKACQKKGKENKRKVTT